ncbi:MAG: hypothetical protein ACK413_02100 [Patescibacteria group bacterium]
MEIPLYIFLIVYLALIFVCFIYLLFNFYHLFKFGSLDWETVFASFLFLAVLIIIIFSSYQAIIKINWRRPFFSFEIPSFLKEIKIELPTINVELPSINLGQ